MYPISQKFQNALLSDHQEYVRLEVYVAGASAPIFTYDPTVDAKTMHIIDGSITHDKQSSTRMRLTNLTIVDPTFALVPNDASSVFSPFGNEIIVYKGIVFSDGTTESVPMGRFRITRVETAERDGAATIVINGYDRAWIVGSRVFTYYWPQTINPDLTVTPWPFQPTNNPRNDFYTDYVRAMLLYAYPEVTFDADAATWQNRQGSAITIDPNVNSSFQMNPGDSPWERSYSLLQSVGIGLYFDRTGIATARRDPAYTYMSAATPPTSVATYIDGVSSTFTDASRSLDTEKSFNRILVTGQGTGVSGPLWSVVADDTDPNSPTWVNGPFGIRAKIVNNQWAVTQDQVNDYAQLLLRTSLGAQRSVTFDGVSNPALDIDDVVTINRQRIGLTNQQFVLDSITFPLKPGGSMSARLREIRALV